MSPKRGDDVPPPPIGNEWRLRFATNDAAKGWGDLCTEAPGNTRRCYEALRADPVSTNDPDRQHRLRGRLASATLGGTEYPQWEYEVTAAWPRPLPRRPPSPYRAPRLRLHTAPQGHRQLTHVAPYRRQQLPTRWAGSAPRTERAPPTWDMPVGDGAKRTHIGFGMQPGLGRRRARSRRGRPRRTYGAMDQLGGDRLRLLAQLPGLPQAPGGLRIGQRATRAHAPALKRRAGLRG